MQWTENELMHLLNEYDASSEEVLSSDASSFLSNLKRFMHLISNNEYFTYINDVVLEKVDFEEWYKKSSSTVGGMVGSGTLDWPIERKEYIAMQLSLLNSISEGNITTSNICSKFMSAGKYHDDQIDKVNEQITEIFIKNYRKLFVTTAEQAASELGEKKEKRSSVHAWYQRPVGMVLLGLLITVTGGIVLLKLTGKL